MHCPDLPRYGIKIAAATAVILNKTPVPLKYLSRSSVPWQSIAFESPKDKHSSGILVGLSGNCKHPPLRRPRNGEYLFVVWCSKPLATRLLCTVRELFRPWIISKEGEQNRHKSRRQTIPRGHDACDYALRSTGLWSLDTHCQFGFFHSVFSQLVIK